MAVHLLLFGNSTPPNELLDGAIVVVDELAFRVVVTIPARQVAVVEHRSFAAIPEERPRAFALVASGYSPTAMVTEVAQAVAQVLQPQIPVAVVVENTSGAETR